MDTVDVLKFPPPDLLILTGIHHAGCAVSETQEDKETGVPGDEDLGIQARRPFREGGTSRPVLFGFEDRIASRRDLAALTIHCIEY